MAGPLLPRARPDNDGGLLAASGRLLLGRLAPLVRLGVGLPLLHLLALTLALLLLLALRVGLVRAVERPDLGDANEPLCSSGAPGHV